MHYHYFAILSDSNNSVAPGGGDINDCGLGTIRSDAHSISAFFLLDKTWESAITVPDPLYQFSITDLLDFDKVSILPQINIPRITRRPSSIHL